MYKDFDRWNKIKKKINQRGYPKFKVGEIWWCSFGLNVGVEQDGDSANFQRPVIIIYKFSHQIILVAPLTNREANGHWYLEMQFLSQKSTVILNQIKPIDVKRLVKNKGQIIDEQVDEILSKYIELINKKHPEG